MLTTRETIQSADTKEPNYRYDGHCPHVFLASRCQGTNSTGKERDSESSLDNFGARYFSSPTGRFISPDDPFTGWDQGDPQTWNLYSYVRNNPLNMVDDDGHDPNPAGSCGGKWSLCHLINWLIGNFPEGPGPHQQPVVWVEMRVLQTGVSVGANRAMEYITSQPPPPGYEWLNKPENQMALGMISGFPEVEYPELLAPAGNKMAQIIARLGIGRGNPSAAMQELTKMRNAAAQAGQVAKGFYIQADVTIFRLGNDYLTVAKDGKILSFVKNAISGERVALKYLQLGGK